MTDYQTICAAIAHARRTMTALEYGQFLMDVEDMVDERMEYEDEEYAEDGGRDMPAGAP